MNKLLRAASSLMFVASCVRFSLWAQTPKSNFSNSQIVTTSIWEGQILEPKRPIVADINFVDQTATFSTTGSRSWPVTVDSLAENALKFAVHGNGWNFDFQGTATFDAMKGEVTFSNRKSSFILCRLPILPKPKNRVEAWRQDIAVLNNRFIRYDRSFSPEAQEDFLRNLKNIDASLPTLSNQQVMVDIARTLALAHNGHTRLYLMRNRTVVRRVPLRIWWFNDGLYIVRADRENSSLLGCRILKIGSHSVAKAFSDVENTDAGSATWKRYMSSYFLTSPDILFGAGVLSSSDSEPLTISCGGAQRDVTLSTPPLQRSNEPDEAWRDLAPGYDDHGLLSVLPDRNLPLYLQKPTENYWFTYIPQSKLLYLQYNRAQDSANGPSAAQFESAVEQAIDSNHPQALAFDLRFNTGGDGFLAEPLLRMIASKTPRLKVFEIVGRSTFSAGIMAAAELREWAHATIVGEPAGDGLHFWAEGGNLVLPNSGLTAHYANGFHNYSMHSYPNVQPFVRLTVNTLSPSLPTTPSWNQYLHGEDVCLKTILEELKVSP